MVPDQGLLYPLTRRRREAGGPPAAPLVARALRVSFGPVRALDGLDLVVPPGEVVGLVGPNGCGKTTTLRAVLGLVPLAGGEAAVCGFRAGSLAARAESAYVPDEPSGLDELSVDELLRLVAALWRAPSAYARRAAALLDAFGLAESRAILLHSLSHGRRRIAAIVAAAALDRSLLLVDEATAALDPEAVVVLREVLRAAAARGTGVLVATQDLHFAETVCGQVALLASGSVAAAGPVDAVCAAYGAASLEEAFVRAVGVERRLEAVRDALGAR